MNSVFSVANSANNNGRKRFGTRVWHIARGVLVLYLLVVLANMIFERSLVYPIPPVSRGDWQPAGLGHEDVKFQSLDGTWLHGWFVPHPHAKRAILYCHGNAEQVGDLGYLAAQLRDELEASVFVFDYRGYGHSEGQPDEAGCIADGQAARNWLANRLGLQRNDVILMGRSLGGGVAVALAADGGARALVLENTFPSAVEVAARHFPWLPVRWVMKNRYDSLSRMPHYDGPLFMVHGAVDELIPPAFARQLFDVSKSTNKRFMEIPDRGHNDPWPNHYYQELKSFLDRLADGAKNGPADGV